MRWEWIGFVVLGVLILFQSEIRSVAYKLRYPRTIRFLRRLPRTEIADEIVDAVDRLSRSGNGAIIAIEQEVALDPYVETGTDLEANVSSDLIITIFTPYTPLHDGAVIIRDGVVLGAGCILPLSQATFTDRMLGTRHRAAVGLSEVTDSLVVIVSEENASISVAHKGALYRSLSTSELRDILNGQMPKQASDQITQTI